MNRTMPELLIPAGGPEALKCAVRYGADAVYLGGEAFGLRARARNFTPDEMEYAVRFCHERGVKVYVTANVLAHNEEMEKARAYFEELRAIGPDALILSDPGLFCAAREVWPDAEIHISTQANNTNFGTFRFWRDLGAKRVVAVRELSLSEIREIRKETPSDLEIETFVHGAMCISCSGRCLLSSFLTGRDANRGSCTHPCRWRYAVVEETRPGEYLPVEENDLGTYLFNSKDLCMIDHLPDLWEAGIDSFKVEGRMKSALYVATVTRAYRMALDDLAADPARYGERIPWYRSEVEKCADRPFTTGFFYGQPDKEAQYYEAADDKSGTCVYLGTAGTVRADGSFALEQKNKFQTGEEIEILKPDGRNRSVRVVRITDEDGFCRESAPHPKQKLWVKCTEEPEEGDVLRTAPRKG